MRGRVFLGLAAAVGALAISAFPAGVALAAGRWDFFVWDLGAGVLTIAVLAITAGALVRARS